MTPCTRCNGLMIAEFDEIHYLKCLLCGARILEPVKDAIVSPRIMGTSLCEFCSNPRQKRSTTCRLCGPSERAIKKYGTGPVHDARISEGFAQARNR